MFVSKTWLCIYCFIRVSRIYIELLNIQSSLFLLSDLLCFVLFPFTFSVVTILSIYSYTVPGNSSSDLWTLKMIVISRTSLPFSVEWWYRSRSLCICQTPQMETLFWNLVWKSVTFLFSILLVNIWPYI